MNGYDKTNGDTYKQNVLTRLDRIIEVIDDDFGDIGLKNVDLEDDVKEIHTSMKKKINSEKDRINDITFREIE